MIAGYVMEDKFSCISPEDSGLWLQLFYLAEKHVNRDLCDRLQYIRNCGAKLEKNRQFGYVIKPVISAYSWSSIKEYNREKQCLNEYKDKIIKLLRFLASRGA